LNSCRTSPDNEGTRDSFLNSGVFTVKYAFPLMLMALLVVAGCKKEEGKAADKPAGETATAVSHGDIETPPGFDDAVKSGQPVLVDFYADW
jgi:thiol:disulfide interchange protein